MANLRQKRYEPQIARLRPVYRWALRVAAPRPPDRCHFCTFRRHKLSNKKIMIKQGYASHIICSVVTDFCCAITLN